MFDDQASELKSSEVVRNENFVRSRSRRCCSGYPLAMAKGKEKLTIMSMHGGRHYRRQLMDMGLRPGLQITVLRAGGGGPVLIQVGETRLGLGRGMAEKIEVVPTSDAGSL